MFQLIREGIDFSALNRPSNIAYHRVFDTVKETGSVHFLHGVAVDIWKDRLAVCFAFNRNDENSITEQLLMRWSDDGGHTWSETKPLPPPRNMPTATAFSCQRRMHCGASALALWVLVNPESQGKGTG